LACLTNPAKVWVQGSPWPHWDSQVPFPIIWLFGPFGQPVEHCWPVLSYENRYCPPNQLLHSRPKASLNRYGKLIRPHSRKGKDRIVRKKIDHGIENLWSSVIGPLVSHSQHDIDIVRLFQQSLFYDIIYFPKHENLLYVYTNYL